MSWKETITSGTEKVLSSVGVSKESTDYVRKQLGELLDQVETKITGVPQIKDVEAMWYEAYALNVKQEELKKRLFSQESIANAYKGDPERYAQEIAKVNKLKSLISETHEAHVAIVKKATDAQNLVLAARKKS
jgi:UDP-N-acetylglucosamine enolpyruvyl transferase